MSDASIRVEDHFPWHRLRDLNLKVAAEAGADVIMWEAVALCPKDTGELAATAFIDPARGGPDEVAFGFDSVYAAWIHEHLHFQHPHGGQAKFQEAAMLIRKDEALDAAGRVVFDGLT